MMCPENIPCKLQGFYISENFSSTSQCAVSQKCILLNLLYAFNLPFPVLLLRRKISSTQSQIHYFSRILCTSTPLSLHVRCRFFGLSLPKWLKERLHAAYYRRTSYLMSASVTAAYWIPVSSIQQVLRDTIGWIERRRRRIAWCILKIPSGALGQVFSTRVPNIP